MIGLRCFSGRFVWVPFRFARRIRLRRNVSHVFEQISLGRPTGRLDVSERARIGSVHSMQRTSSQRCGHAGQMSATGPPLSPVIVVIRTCEQPLDGPLRTKRKVELRSPTGCLYTAGKLLYTSKRMSEIRFPLRMHKTQRITASAREFAAEPGPDFVFSHCPDETEDEETDACMGCAGWGYECGAIYELRQRGLTARLDRVESASSKEKQTMSWSIGPFIALSFAAAKAEVNMNFDKMKLWGGGNSKEYEDARAHLLSALSMCEASTQKDMAIRFYACGSKSSSSYGNLKVEIDPQCVALEPTVASESAPAVST